MKLYTVPLAPNPMRVTLYMAEREALGCHFDVEKVVINTLKGKHREPEHLARNPWGTLPVLELDSGGFITESLSIIDYLEAAVEGPRLVPEDPEAMALARNLERTVEMRITFDLGWYVHFQKSPLGLPQDPAKAAELAERMQPGFDWVNDLLSDGRPFISGDAPGLADCTLAA
ncbi:MAG: glutathione S-transferase family protein, partial [Luminiphilus sp.]|nr:glutathione S-transferase family protein [Luminiphilus sp.]